MAESFLPREEFDKCPKLQEARHASGVNFSYLYFTDDILNHLACEIHGLCIGRCNKDIPIFMDVDIHPGLIDDFAHDLAAGTDDIAYFLNVDANCFYTRCIRRELFCRLIDTLKHFGEDKGSSLLCLLKG